MLSLATAAIPYTPLMRAATSEAPSWADAAPKRCAKCARSESFWRRYTNTSAIAMTTPAIAGAPAFTKSTAFA
jgi:hypothetical protein